MNIMKMKPKSKKSKLETLDEFLEKIEKHNADITTLTENVKSLKSINNKILNEPSQTERQKHLGQQTQLVNNNKLIGRKLQKQIKEDKSRLASVPVEDRTCVSCLNVLPAGVTQVKPS